MTISVGDHVPDVKVMLATEDGPQQAQTGELFKGKKVALFSVPGAFTPTCSAKHLPGFVEKAAALKEKGVDEIICLAVNDAFVMQAWAKDQNAFGKVVFLSDGNAGFAQALGLTFDGSGFGMGERSQRFSLVAEDGVVKHLFVEEPGAFEVSSAEHMLRSL